MRKACIVGFGVIGTYHAKLLETLPFAELYAICDIDDEKLERAGVLYPSVKLFKDYKEMLKDESIDTVHICTPHFLHCEMAENALNADKNVLLEKPVCISINEFERIKKAEEKAKGILGIVFQNRANPCVQKLIEKLPEIGELIGVSGRVLWSRDEEYYKAAEWKGKWKTEGGGVLINQAIHTFDILGYITGGFTSVYGSISAKKLGDVIEVEDTVDAHLETVNGVEVMFYASNCYLMDTPVMVEVTGENATLRMADNNLYEIRNGMIEKIASDTKPADEKACYGVGHKGLIYKFYSYLETGKGEYIPLEDTENTMKALFGLYESARENKRVFI